MSESVKDQALTSLEKLIQSTTFLTPQTGRLEISGSRLEELERKLQEDLSTVDRADAQRITERLEKMESLIRSSIHHLSSRINVLSSSTSSSFESAELSATVGQWARLRSFLQETRQRLTTQRT